MSTATPKWLKTARIPCERCGGPTGWKASRQLGYSPRCQSCRSDYSDFQHGTRRGYREAGCRCSECVGWNRSINREYVARRRVEGRPIKRFGSSGPWIAESVRLAVFERDGWTCQLCGGALDKSADPNGDMFPSIDHVIPQSKGGGHDASNLRAAHRWCNSVRQDRVA